MLHLLSCSSNVMGTCFSASAADGEAYKKGATKGKEKPPDFGLGDAFEVIKFLGKGAEGEAWLCKVCKE